jgi:hypothetical protein
VALRAAGLLLAAALLGAAAADAQNPQPTSPTPSARPADTATVRAAPPDTGQAARAPGDTLAPPDSLSPDTFRAQLPRLGAPPGPLPRSGRIVFDRDALWFSGALTLGELLEHVPGVFLVRAGWFGRPEVVHYAGQGASSLELFWDGFALDPLGRDSAGIDVSQISLGLLQRVEVEVLPTALRIYLFSDGQPVRRARTETSFATGDASTNTYRIRYLNRWRGGTGLGLGVEFLGTAAGRAGSGHSNNLALWGKGSWVPSPRFGVEYQAVSTSANRDAFTVTSLGGSAFPIGNPESHRTDLFLRGFVASRDDGMGLRFDALAGSTSYTDSLAQLNRDELQGAAIVSYRAQRWSGELTTRVRDTSTPLEIELRAAASPLSTVTVSGSADTRSHVAGRHSLDVSLGAEFRPRRALAIHGAARMRDAVAVPAVLADMAQRVTDLTAGVSLSGRLADLDVSLARHGGYAPPLYGVFDSVVPAYPNLPVRTVTASFAIRPTMFVTVAGWYRHPLDPISSAYEPPHHSRVWATFRSRLLPILRRNAFDFTAEVAMEGWGHGALGADQDGAPIRLPGATVFDWRAELRLLGAALFWTVRNARGERYAVLPGVPVAQAGQRYGVRWEFTN